LRERKARCKHVYYFGSYLCISKSPIVHIVDTTMFYPAETGGVRTYLAAKARWLAQHTRIRHTVVAPAWKESGGDSFVSVKSLPIPHSNGYRMPVSISAAASALQQLEPDLIEVGDPYQLAWAALRVKRRMDVPVAAFYHSDMPRIAANRFGRVAEYGAARYVSWLYRKFDLVLAPSALIADRLRAMGIEHAIHQPLGVDTCAFCPERRDPSLRQRLGLGEDARLLVYAGRFTPEKKLSVLMEAVRRLGHPYHLLMIGAGDPIAPAKHISCLPFQKDAATLAGLLASCDALVHPGDQETFGLVVLEAMACGIPVVGTAAGGVQELIDCDTGLLVQPGSIEALAEGITELYRKDPAALGAQGRRKVLERYDWNSVIPQLMGHYAQLFAAHRRAELEAEASYVVE
jgi:alpha-1,6-mannosyltransferase